VIPRRCRRTGDLQAGSNTVRKGRGTIGESVLVDFFVRRAGVPISKAAVDFDGGNPFLMTLY